MTRIARVACIAGNAVWIGAILVPLAIITAAFVAGGGG